MSSHCHNATERLPRLLEETTLKEGEEEEEQEDTCIIMDLPSVTPPTNPNTTSANPNITNITQLVPELQVNILSYLRAYDLASMYQTCHYYSNPILVHSIVTHAAECVYPIELTKGFESQPVMSTTACRSAAANSEGGSHNHSNSGGNKKGGKKKGPTSSSSTTAATATISSSSSITSKGNTSTANEDTTTTTTTHYTFEHLRNMELLVVARVLSRPEPRTVVGDDDVDDNPGLGGGGYYYVSKSWCKTALKWLEWQQERQQEAAAAAAAAAAAHNNNNKKKQQHKKLSKKQQRLRQRKYSDASPPWPNVNSDIVCCHDQLQLCSNRKSARARRKILDKQAWKCLKKLYPESISLEAKRGECIQCLLEIQAIKRTKQQQEEQIKEQRKAPLGQPILRRFYTRTRGVPTHCLLSNNKDTNDIVEEDANMSAKKLFRDNGKEDNATEEEQEEREGDCKSSINDIIVNPSICNSITMKKGLGGCPLIPGLYYAVPRAWCHAWRKYMKTGEGGTLLPPDASALLCDAHRLSLLPPHLESYLYGESPQLWLSKKQQQDEEQQHLQQLQQQQQMQQLDETVSSSAVLGSPVARRSVVGLSPATTGNSALPADFGFLTPAELAQQQRAMMTLERQREREAALQQQQQQEEEQMMNGSGRRTSFSAGEQLDRENYCCVEILAHDELEALEKLWPRGTSVFRLSFEVLPGQEVSFSTQPCRECDASGMANFCKIPKTSKAHLRAAHQARVRIYKEQKSGSNNTTNTSGGNSKPGVQVEY